MMLAVQVGGETAADVDVLAVAVPSPTDTEVLVRVEAAGLNPYDLGIVTGHARGTRLPFPPGRDLAGTVIAGPPGWIGAHVWATGGELGRDRPGTHAEYVTLPVRGVRRVPAALTAVAAATVGVSFTTAWWALTDGGAASGAPLSFVGERVLVTGAAGAVGTAAMQLAGWLGASTTWGYDRLPSSVPDSESLFSDWPLLARAMRAGGGPSVVVDTVGAPVLGPVVDECAPGARIMTMSTPGDGHAELNLRTFYRKGLRLIGVNSGTKDVVADAEVLDRLAPGFAAGALTPPVVNACFPLSHATDAYRSLERRPPGKVVLVSD